MKERNFFLLYRIISNKKKSTYVSYGKLKKKKKKAEVVRCRYTAISDDPIPRNIVGY